MHTRLGDTAASKTARATRPPRSTAVVGNGPLSASDRTAIEQYAEVVRLNDATSCRPGERTTRLVIRHPSAWAAPASCVANVPVEYVAVVPDAPALPAHANVTWVYEPQYGARSRAPADARIFARCARCPMCYHNRTFAGPSTGAVVLSALQERADVRRIDVYGMNWHGNRRMHGDFADRTLVRRCCTKCVVHPTASQWYKAQWWMAAAQAGPASAALVALAAVAALAALATLVALATARRPPRPSVVVVVARG